MDEEDDEDFSMLVKNLTGREFLPRQRVAQDDGDADDGRGSWRSNRVRNSLDRKDPYRSHSRGNGRGSYRKDFNRRNNRDLGDHRNKNTGGRSMEEPRNRLSVEEDYRHNSGYRSGGRGRVFSEQKIKTEETRREMRERDQGSNDDFWFSHGGKNLPCENHLDDQVRRNGFEVREEKEEEEEEEEEEEDEDSFCADEHQDRSTKRGEKIEEENGGTVGSNLSYCASDSLQNSGKKRGEKEEEEETETVGSDGCHVLSEGMEKEEQGVKEGTSPGSNSIFANREEEVEEEKGEAAEAEAEAAATAEEEEEEEGGQGGEGEEQDEEEEEIHHLQNLTLSITTVLNHKPETCPVSPCLVEEQKTNEQKTPGRNATDHKTSDDDSNIADRKTIVLDQADRSFISCIGGSRRRRRSSAIRDYPRGYDGSIGTASATLSPRLSSNDGFSRESQTMEYPVQVHNCSDIDGMPADLADPSHGVMHIHSEDTQCSKSVLAKDGDLSTENQSMLEEVKMIDIGSLKHEEIEKHGCQKFEEMDVIGERGGQKLEDVLDKEKNGNWVLEEAGNQENNRDSEFEEAENQEKNGVEGKDEIRNRSLEVMEKMIEIGNQDSDEMGKMEELSISVCTSEYRQDVSLNQQQEFGEENISDKKLEEIGKTEDLSTSEVLEDTISVCSGKSGGCSAENQVISYMPTDVIVLDPEKNDPMDSVQVIDSVLHPETGSHLDLKGNEGLVSAFPSFQSMPNVTRRPKLQFKRKVIVLDDDHTDPMAANRSAVQGVVPMDRAANLSAVQDVAHMDSRGVHNIALIPEIKAVGTLLSVNRGKLSISSSDMEKDGDETYTPLLEGKKGLDARSVESSGKRLNIMKKPKVQHISESPDNRGALVPLQNTVGSSLSRLNGPEKAAIHCVVPSSSKALVPFVNSRNALNKPANDVVKMYSQRARSRITHHEHGDVTAANFMSDGSSATGLPQDGMSARALVKRTLHEFESLRREYVKSKDNVKSRRSDLEAGALLRQRGRWQNQSEEKIIGAVPGIEVGDQFCFRIEMLMIGLHRQLQGGIDYIPASKRSNGRPLATSIVASGGYEDDKDSGEKLIYTGQGGNNYKGDKRQGSDQSLVRGNLAMSNCMKERTPVRVIRGTVDLASPSSKLYTYDGLYDVVNVHFDSGAAGFGVYQFTLIRRPGQPQLGLSIVQFVGNLKKKGLARPNLLLEDISNGQENFPVCVVNEVDGDPAPSNFIYIAKIKYPIWFPHGLPRGCDCEDGCSDDRKCICTVKNGGELPYNERGYIIRDKKVVYECGNSCRCSSSCPNRVSQKGLRYQLEVFKTKNRGWGVRSVNPIQPGGFICEYTGELLSDVEAEQRVDNDEYLFDLGNNCNLESSGGGGSQPENLSTAMIPSINEDTGYTIDAKCMGNVARFINHSCSPNLFAQNVLYDSNDLRFPHVMLFAMESIPPMRELTYDYNYAIDQVHDANGNIKKKACYCGAPDCKGRLY